MRDLLAADHPQSCRQLFYQMTSRGLIAKTEGEYRRTICRQLALMRRDGEIPFHYIADSTRWMRKPTSYSSAEAALRRTAEAYRRSLWDDQDCYVEIWLEKDALSGVLYGVTSQWDVPLMVTRGYPSLSFLHGAAEAIASINKPTFIYYAGDWDPSGLDITRAVEEGLREFAPEAMIMFERIAVTEEQIEDLELPTRPTKQSDSRSKGFVGRSVEVDSIPAANLRNIVNGYIEIHVDSRALEITRKAEEHERTVLMSLLGNLNGARP